ncbi:hypothetical protein TRICI_000643 [Trichomonascus ciferrii]|uniref:RING-type domain-containing protein n=1 Tax=Trichomonascus ciferrii TaxID=44093 RepID=A0A642VAQ2_9ASCO|nr:hypothetical protein TRICI_000643 [Trichomonascus ciferrii]
MKVSGAADGDVVKRLTFGYLDDHNVNLTERGATQNSHSRNTLAQHLNDFFSNPSGDPSRDIGGPRSAYMSLASALEVLHESPLLDQLISQLQTEAGQGAQPQGVPQSFLDGLDRVPKKKLKESDSCPICATSYLEDEHPLVVQLPCNAAHHFDLECIGPWLKLHSTCPLCRKNLLEKNELPEYEDSEEEFDDTYG